MKAEISGTAERNVLYEGSGHKYRSFFNTDPEPLESHHTPYIRTLEALLREPQFE